MEENRIYRRCSSCGAVLSQGEIFCNQCGRQVKDTYSTRKPEPSSMSRGWLNTKRNTGRAAFREEKSSSQRGDRKEKRDYSGEGILARKQADAMTFMQLLLILFLSALLLILMVLGLYWKICRTTSRDFIARGGKEIQVQTEQVQTEEHQPIEETKQAAADTGEPAETAAEEVSVYRTDNAAQWSLPESSDRLLTSEELEGYSYDDLQMAINEIYARHGRIFSEPEINEYFESQDWYQGTADASSFEEEGFTAVEWKNIDLLIAEMDARAEENDGN